MKTKNILIKALLTILVIVPFFISCSSSDDGGGDSVTAITLSTTTSSVLEGTSVGFSVVDNLNNNVTSTVTLSINGATISNPYTFNTEGVYTVMATLNSLTSSVSITVEAPPQATAITLSSDRTEINLGESVTFSIEDDLNNNVTTLSVIEVDGTAISSNSYIFNVAGDFTVEATYQNLTSNEITITVIAPSPFSDSSSFSSIGAPATFTKKALLEDFTGTWCPNCPPAAQAIANARSGNSNIFGVGYHDGDPMQISETQYWSSYYNVTGFPTVYVNGADTRWDYGSMAQVNAELAEIANVGLAVNADLVGGKLDMEVQVGYNSAISEEIRLRIYLVEDNVTSSSAQAGSSEGVNYVHKDVLREVYTDQLGDVISTSHIGSGGVLTRTLTGLDLPNNIDDNSNLKVIVLVHNTYTKTFTDYFDEVHTNSPHYDIYNVQEVHMGGTQSFD